MPNTPQPGRDDDRKTGQTDDKKRPQDGVDEKSGKSGSDQGKQGSERR